MNDLQKIRPIMEQAIAHRDDGGKFDGRNAKDFLAAYETALALITAQASALAEARKRIEQLLGAFKSHIDGRDLLDELCPQGWHHCDIIVRINGEDRQYEADWLKNVWYARKPFLTEDPANG